jgi:toxin ParE1/3/4
MSKPLQLLPVAEAELDDATDWYEQRQPGLGSAFVVRVEELFRRITNNPRMNPAVYKEVRKAKVIRFPYVVLYKDQPTEVLVISVFHTSRDPSIRQARA